MRKFSQNRIGTSAKRITFAMVLAVACFLLGNIGATFSAIVFSDLERSAGNTFKAGRWPDPDEKTENETMKAAPLELLGTEEEKEKPEETPPTKEEPEIIPEPPVVEPLEPKDDVTEPTADDLLPDNEESPPETDEKPIESPVDKEV